MKPEADVDFNIERARQLVAEKKYSDALSLLEPLAANGLVEAMSDLAMLLLFADPDVTVDGKRAERLLIIAAEKGNACAAHNLATLYITGAPGCEPRPELSKQYYQLARNLGFQIAPDSFYE